jgi:hypothetical protein
MSAPIDSVFDAALTDAKNNITGTFQSVFTPTITNILFWILAIYIFFSIVKEIFAPRGAGTENTSLLAFSRSVDIACLLLLMGVGVYYYRYDMTPADKQNVTGYILKWTFDFFNDPYSLLECVVFMFVFFALVYVLRVPMTPELKPVIVHLIEHKIWILFAMFAFLYFFKYALGIPILEIIYNNSVVDYLQGSLVAYPNVTSAAETKKSSTTSMSSPMTSTDLGSGFAYAAGGGAAPMSSPSSGLGDLPKCIPETSPPIPTDKCGNVALPTDKCGNQMPTQLPTDKCGNVAPPTDKCGNTVQTSKPVPTDKCGNVAPPTDKCGNAYALSAPGMSPATSMPTTSVPTLSAPGAAASTIADKCGYPKFPTSGSEEVYNVGNNVYNYDEAQAVCKAYGARLATYDEIENAYNDGGEWCNYGWSEGQMAYFPTQKDTWDMLQRDPKLKHACGRPGINGGFIDNPNVKFGANCFGVKPMAPKDWDPKPIAISAPVTGSLEDPKVKELKNRGYLNGFNQNIKKWSEH